MGNSSKHFLSLWTKLYYHILKRNLIFIIIYIELLERMSIWILLSTTIHIGG